MKYNKNVKKNWLAWNKFFRASHLDRHTSTMETLRKKSSSTLHTFVTSTKVNFRESESVTQVHTTIHIRVRHTGHVLGVYLMKIFRVGMFFNSGCIDFESLVAIPEATCCVFESTKSITLSSLFATFLVILFTQFHSFSSLSCLA